MVDKKKPQEPCGKLNKNCRSCQHRFKAGVRTVECPNCGEDRRCRTPKLKGKKACRMHGGNAGRKPGPKYILGDKLNRSMNRLLGHPDIFTLGNEIAANQHRIEELLRLSEEIEAIGLGPLIDKGLEMIEWGIINGDENKMRRGSDMIKEARMKARAHNSVWEELREHMKLDVSMKTSQQKMRLEAEEMISVIHVREVISTFQQILFRVIKNPEDRKFVIDKMREYYRPNE